MNAIQKSLVAELVRRFPDTTEFSRREILSAADSVGAKYSNINAVMDMGERVRKGIYDLSGVVVPFQKQQMETSPVHNLTSMSSDDVYVPARDNTYVAWGFFKDVEMIIKSEMFYPTFITGLSGNGKTMMVEQACAKAGRQYVRVQITPETDEDDLIGGFRLINGETVFFKGPVVHAMEAGAILLIDEIDRASNKLMCLQGVLEGKPVLLKKTGEVVKPAPGFNVIATANTKGKGSEDGRFTAATIIDDAFLERFTITMEQPFPTLNTEKKIVVKHMEKFGSVDKEYADKLCVWAEVIRKTFEDDGVDEVVSTRRLCHIAQTFAIFNDRVKAIELCISRFDSDTKAAFIDLYTKVDADALPKEETPTEVLNENQPNDGIPF